MTSSYFLLFALFAVLLVTSHAASSSYSCVFVNGQRKCTSQDDPNGNMAGAAAAVDGGMGAVGAGAGTQDNFNTDYQQIGAGDGSNGGGGAVAVGTGGFPQFNGNPFEFVQNFMRRFGRNEQAQNQ